MRLRRLGPGDFDALGSFPLGGRQGAWFDEVVEIVEGLAGWESEPLAARCGREVLVLEDAGVIVAIAAHEATIAGSGRVDDRHRYLMVTAVRHDRQRQGLARLLVESIAADVQRRGVVSLTWLVHPHNLNSMMFSRSVFPDADETYPPEDRPYAAFTLRLD